MPTSDELAQMQHSEWALCLLIDAEPRVFVDHSDLVDYDFGDDRQGVLGLSREGLSFRLGIDLRASQFEDSTVRFTIRDFEGDLAAVFRAVADDEEDLVNVPFASGSPVAPGDDLSARTELHDKYIGPELIGPAGERHLYPAPPGFSVGLAHAISVPSLDLAGSPVSDAPIVWAGRRVCLYRIYRDHVTYPSRSAGTSSWRPFSERELLWFGTLQDQGSVRGHEWTLVADGPESWLRKPLAVGFQPNAVTANGVIELNDEDGEDERQISVRLLGDNTTWGSSLFVAPLTAGTVDQLIAQVAQVIDDAANAAGLGGTWADEAGWSVSMQADASVRICVANGTLFGGEMRLEMHRNVWALLGYDVDDQALLEQDPDNPEAIAFYPSDEPYGDGYFTGNFVTGLEGWPAGEDNHGVTRVWEPIYKGGTHVLPWKLGPEGVDVLLADALVGGGTTVGHPGQLDKPIRSSAADASAPVSIGVNECDRQGLFLFYGKRRFDGSEEEFDEYQVARACWVGGALQQGGLVSGDTIKITEWLDPRMFGFNRGKLKSDWIARANAEDDLLIHAVPIASLSYRDELDRSDLLIQRLLVTTGTSEGWDAPSKASPQLDAGDNEPTHEGTVVRDAEHHSLGLAIPEEFVASVDDWNAERDLVDDEDALRVKVAFSTGYQAEDVLRSLMQPVGWCWHLRGGRFGVFCPAHSVTQADVEVSLDRSVKAAEYGKATSDSNEIRAFAPIDKFTIDYNWAPFQNKTTLKAEQAARDSGYRYRPGAVEHKMIGHHHRPQLGGWYKRVALLSTFWAQRHFIVRGWPVHLVNPGRTIWPGTVVRLTDPTLTDPAGNYQISNRIGFVLGTHTDLASGKKLLDILVLAQSSSNPRLHAPSARGIGYDTSARRLYLEDNWLDAETSALDASFMEEPDYVGITPFGGDMILVCKQWDGDTWAETLRGEVEAIGTTPGASYVQFASGSVTGTYLRDQDCIVVPDTYDDQNAGEWPQQIYGVIADEDGEFDSGGGLGPGYKWEP